MSGPLNIAVIAKKGGIGKSNVSIKLFEAFRHVGKRVQLNDWDPQGTSTKAMRCFYPSYDDERPTDPDIIIWDTPPNLEHGATAAAARNADIAVVLTTPAPSDAWEAAETVEFIKEKNPKAIVRIVCNKYKKGTILSRLVDTTREDLKAAYLPVMLNERECYKHIVVTGWKGLDGPAKQEVLEFAVAVVSLNRR
ncbi:MAG: AAA family ATPase [Bryobacteraceae bacterium]|jgi:MinD-like ATPase involved in chromosome partitioning or flagellar assembly